MPAVWLVRGGFEFGAYLYRFGFFFAVGLLFVVHFASHVQSGLPLQLYPPRLFAALARPHTVLSFAGLFLASWTLLLAAESLAYGGMWSALKRATVDDRVRPWADAMSGAFETFGRAVGVRLLVRLCEATLAVTLVGTCLALVNLAGVVRNWSESDVLIPALVCALVLTVVSLAAVVVRLTAELVAATVYVDDVGLGEGITRAANVMVERPVYIYRLFIVAAAVLIPPLLVGWAAALGQNAFIVADLGLVASFLRFGAEIAIVVGLVMFSVMMHATFFAYYAWTTHRVEPQTVTKKDHPELSDFLPEHYGHVANVDDILGAWDDAGPAAARGRPRPPAGKPPAPRVYDLGAILAGGEEE